MEHHTGRYGEAFNVQPFGNTLVVKTRTGQQIYDVLNQQFGNPAPGSNRIMLPSANVHYQWTTTGGPHIIDGSVSFDGGATPISTAGSYRVVMNNFMADGGTTTRSSARARNRSVARWIST